MKTPLAQFEALLWQYDAKHIAKQAKNPRCYRNPNAFLHYSEALTKAKSLAGDDTIESALVALRQTFSPDFWPLKRFEKLNTKDLK